MISILLADEALQAGAAGFLVKDTRPELLLDGIRAVHRGVLVFDSCPVSVSATR